MLPAHRKSFAPEWQKSAAAAEEAASKVQEKVEGRYNRRAKDLPNLQPGIEVVLQNHDSKRWDTYGVIVDVGPHRKYFIRLASGRILTRNRRFIRRRYAYALPTQVEPLHQQPAIAEPSKVPLRRSARHTKKPDRLIETV